MPCTSYMYNTTILLKVSVLWLDMVGHGWTWLPSSGELFAARQGIPNYQFPIAKWLVQDLSCWDVGSTYNSQESEITCNFLVWGGASWRRLNKFTRCVVKAFPVDTKIMKRSFGSWDTVMTEWSYLESLQLALRSGLGLYGGFLKWWYPTNMGFPTKNDHFGVFWGYPYFLETSIYCSPWLVTCEFLCCLEVALPGSTPRFTFDSTVWILGVLFGFHLRLDLLFSLLMVEITLLSKRWPLTGVGTPRRSEMKGKGGCFCWTKWCFSFSALEWLRNIGTIDQGVWLFLCMLESLRG